MTAGAGRPDERGAPGRRRQAVLLVATRSIGKLLELRPMIERAGLRPLSLDDAGIAHSATEDRLEIHHTYEQNAIAKARHFHHRYDRLPVLADDSGLEVEALGGMPGVRSKRWGAREGLAGRALDDANNQVLLRSLHGEENRRAKFVCVAAIVWSGGELTARGESSGTVLQSPRGTRGFGYDSLFLSDELGISFAEATPEQKATVSHRSRAAQAVLARFAKLCDAGVDRARGAE